MKPVILSVLMCFASCNRSKELVHGCSDDYSTAALVALSGKLLMTNEVHQMLFNSSQKEIDDERHKIAVLRAWAKNQEPCVRLAYESWLDYAEKGAMDAENELKHHAERDSLDKYREETATQYKRAKDLNIPRPPG